MVRRMAPGRLLPHLAGAALFAGLFALGWGVSDPRTRIPNYSDVLEAMWGIELYYRQIVLQGAWPASVPAIWHPSGLSVGSLGVTPTVFLATLPIRALTGNAALTYNLVTLGALVAGYLSAYRLAREYAGPWASHLAAALYTFAPFHWERVNGHINVNFGLAILPLMMLHILRWRQAAERRAQVRAAILAGLAWGAMSLVQLYGLWWGMLIWMVAAATKLRARGLATALLSPITALALVSPVLAYYLAGSRAMDQVTSAFAPLAGWGASINSLFIPSIAHPVPFVRDFARRLYYGIPNESGTANWGIILPAVALAGALFSTRVRAALRGNFGALAILIAAAFGLALGVALRWQGDFPAFDGLAGIDSALWRIGMVIKPSLFTTAAPPPPFDRSLPLPEYLLALVVPFWDSARVVTRFTLVGGLGLIMLAAIAVQRLPRWAGALVALLLIFEALPARTADLPAPTRSNPAYEWAAGQGNDGAWNILDITDEPKVVPGIVSGEVPYAQMLHGVPVASGLSSYLPRAMDNVWQRLSDAPSWTADPQMIERLRTLKTRFVFVHMRFHWDTRVIDGLRASPFFIDRGCFDGAPDMVFPYQICVAEVKPAAP